MTTAMTLRASTKETTTGPLPAHPAAAAAEVKVAVAELAARPKVGMTERHREGRARHGVRQRPRGGATLRSYRRRRSPGRMTKTLAHF